MGTGTYDQGNAPGSYARNPLKGASKAAGSGNPKPKSGGSVPGGRETKPTDNRSSGSTSKIPSSPSSSVPASARRDGDEFNMGPGTSPGLSADAGVGAAGSDFGSPTVGHTADRKWDDPRVSWKSASSGDKTYSKKKPQGLRTKPTGPLP